MAQAIGAVVGAHFRRMCQGGPRFFSVYNNKMLQGQDVTKYVQSTDFLLNHLKNAGSTRGVLEMVSQHHDIMNDRHIMQALRTLFTLQKNGNSEMSTKEILSNHHFKRLCRKLRTQAASIELNETIDALKIVSYVGVPADATIFQVLLQLIRHNVNHLSLQQIVFLDFLLSQAQPSPLVEALKIALPLVFEIHLPLKLDYDSPSHVAECLYFASRSNLNRDSVERIVEALMRFGELDAKTAKSVIWSICDMETNELFAGLMKKAVDSMLVHIDEVSFNDLETTLTKLIARYSRRGGYFYDATFYESVANYVIDKDLGYKQSIYVLRKFGRVNYFHKFLLDYVAKKVHENPELVTKSDPVDLYSISVSVAMTDYRPVHWDALKDLIAKSDNVANMDKREIIWIRFAAALCLLDVFKLDVLTKCLNETFLKNLFTKKRFMSDFENYSTIWQCIKLFRPELNCLLNKSYDPELIVNNYRQEMEFPMEAALHKALGGEMYVKTDLYSKYGIQIDHAVVFRKGGYPVAMNFPKETRFIEDIDVPQDNHLVAILGLRHFCYTLNSKRLRGSYSLAIRVLESEGFQVVPVDLQVWEGLPDFEKIPYLMRTIKERLDSDLKVSESVV